MKVKTTKQANKRFNILMVGIAAIMMMASSAYGAWDHPEYVRASQQLRKIYQAYNKAPHKQTLSELKAQVNPVLDVIQSTYYRHPSESLTQKTTYYKKQDVVPSLKTPTIGELEREYKLVRHNQQNKQVLKAAIKQNPGKLKTASKGKSFQSMAIKQKTTNNKRHLKNISDTLLALNNTK